MPVVNHSANLATAVVAAIAAHVELGVLLDGRVYGGRAAQNSALPRVIFHEISSASDHTHDSATTSDPGIEETLIQFDIEGLTLSDCRGAGDYLAELFNGATITGGAADIQASFKDPGGFAQPMDYDTGNGVTEAHRISVTYRFLWRDA